MTKILTKKGILLAKELTNIALEDFETAKWLLSVGRFRWGLIALQQSLEKAIKAILLSLCIINTEEEIKKISHQATTHTFKTFIEFSKNIEKTTETLKNMLHQMSGTTLTQYLETLQRVVENERVEISQLFKIAKKIIERAAKKAFSPVTDEDKEKYNKVSKEIYNFINKNIELSNEINIDEILETLPPGAKTAVAPLISLFRPGAPYEELMRILAAFSTWHIVFDYTLSNLRYRTLHLDKNTYIVWLGDNVIQTIDRLKLMSRVHEIIAQLDEDLCGIMRLPTQTNQCIDNLAKKIDRVKTALLEIQKLLRTCQTQQQ
jgi:HEPN domain-containing protein